MVLLTVNWAHVWMVTLLGFALVIVLLIVLIYILKLFGWIMVKSATKGEKKVKTATKATTTATPTKSEATESTDEAAIAMALHLYFTEKHDAESYRLTIRHNGNSTWASKVFGINKLEK